jgi:hypothetical protein
MMRLLTLDNLSTLNSEINTFVGYFEQTMGEEQRYKLWKLNEENF